MHLIGFENNSRQDDAKSDGERQATSQLQQRYCTMESSKS